MPYTPEQRTVHIKAATSAGFVGGALHVVKNHLLLDSLNHGRDFLTLTGVSIREATELLPFFALRQSETLAILPPPGESLDDDQVRPGMVAHKVMCLLPAAGAISGTVSVLKDVRLSDFLATHHAFFAVRDAHLRLGAFGINDTEATAVLVNASRIVGITEFS